MPDPARFFLPHCSGMQRNTSADQCGTGELQGARQVSIQTIFAAILRER
jgi:hypothetical protein